jgi:hypothetical protein
MPVIVGRAEAMPKLAFLLKCLRRVGQENVFEQWVSPNLIDEPARDVGIRAPNLRDTKAAARSAIAEGVGSRRDLAYGRANILEPELYRPGKPSIQGRFGACRQQYGFRRYAVPTALGVSVQLSGS